MYSQKSIDINFIYQSIDVIEELDSKQRKLRSFRGFFLYALEIMEKGKDYEILTTNLQPFFWRKVKNIIRQNQKAALQEFLFEKDENSNPNKEASNPRIQILEDQIQNLHKSYVPSRVSSTKNNSIREQSNTTNQKHYQSAFKGL